MKTKIEKLKFDLINWYKKNYDGVNALDCCNDDFENFFDIWLNFLMKGININDELENCHMKIKSLIDAEINNGSKDYDPNYIRNHVEKLTS